MGQLGDVLEKLFSPIPPFQTLYAKIETRVVGGPLDVCMDPPLDDPEDLYRPIDYSIWAKQPDKLRVDIRTQQRSIVEWCTIICDGDISLRRDCFGNIVHREVRRIRWPSPYLVHFDPDYIRGNISDKHLDLTGESEVATRPCIRVRAVGCDGGSIRQRRLLPGAKEYIFAFDVETALVLQIESHFTETYVQSDTVVHLKLNTELDNNVFTQEFVDERSFSADV